MFSSSKNTLINPDLCNSDKADRRDKMQYQLTNIPLYGHTIDIAQKVPLFYLNWPLVSGGQTNPRSCTIE